MARSKRRFLCCLWLALLLILASITQSTEATENDVDDKREPLVVQPEFDNNVSPYDSPKPAGSYYLAESFDDREAFDKNWINSLAKKDNIDEDIAKYDGKILFVPELILFCL